MAGSEPITNAEPITNRGHGEPFRDNVVAGRMIAAGDRSLPLVAGVPLDPLTSLHNPHSLGWPHEGETQNTTVNNATVTQADIGTCGNTWAMDTFKKSYRLEQNSNGTYNLSIHTSTAPS